MKKIVLISVFIILIAAMVVLGLMLVQTKTSLADTQAKLSAMTTVLTSTESDLTQVTAQLADTKSDLTNTKSNLDEANNKLDETTSELQNTKGTLSSTQDELNQTKIDLTHANSMNIAMQVELDQANSNVDALEKSIDLYKETFGEVYNGGVPITYVLNDSTPPSWTSSGPFISTGYRNYNLVNNPAAVNPTYQQLINFLKTDVTDTYRYVANYYMCGNFAETLHNNAEAAGIRAAMVFISFTEGVGHAINAFLTTDKGLVYIDDTGTDIRGPSSMDGIVFNMRINSIYTPVFLFPSGYAFYPTNKKITEIQIYW